MGNGHGIPIKSIGSSKFASHFNKRVMLNLHKLLHVPKIKKNLLSVSRFAKDNNVFFEFHSRYCLVKSQVTKEVLLNGIEDSDGLYAFKIFPSRAALKSHNKYLWWSLPHEVARLHLLSIFFQQISVITLMFLFLHMQFLNFLFLNICCGTLG